MHYEISHLPYERCWQNWVSAIVPCTLCFYTEFRFLPSSSLSSSSALIHFKWLLFLQVPSQFPDYSLLEVRDPVSPLGLGLEWRRYQMSVLCSAPWWTYPVLRDQPSSPHLQTGAVSCRMPPSLLSLARSGQCMASIKWCMQGSHWQPKSQYATTMHDCDSCNVISSLGLPRFQNWNKM